MTWIYALNFSLIVVKLWVWVVASDAVAIVSRLR